MGSILCRCSLTGIFALGARVLKLLPPLDSSVPLTVRQERHPYARTFSKLNADGSPIQYGAMNLVPFYGEMTDEMNRELTTYGLSREKVVRILHLGSKKDDGQYEPSVQGDSSDPLRQLAQNLLSEPTLNSERRILRKSPSSRPR